ncbi:MAG: hypothetical protein MUF00_01050 [Gemmatimonadaceae bacterium]|nr:hypothetical protein [Gemmatimonadaceae bacterium]
MAASGDMLLGMRQRRHSAAWRLVALILGCWFVLLRTEPVALHACPMHEGLHAHAGPSAEAPSAVSGDHAHAHEHSAPGAPASHDDDGCLCLGACCAAGLAVLPTAPAVTEIAVTLTPGNAVDAVDHSAAPRPRPARLLPFATAPPIAA